MAVAKKSTACRSAADAHQRRLRRGTGLPAGLLGDDMSQLEKHQAELQSRWDENLRAILAGEGGRAILWSLIDKYRPHEAAYTGEALSSAFADGRKEPGRWLMAECQRVSEGDFWKMAQEQSAAAKYEATFRASLPVEE